MRFDDHCVFCKIIKGELPCREVWQNEYCLAFHDLYPKANTHVLLVPKHHIDGIKSVQPGDKEWLGQFMLGIAEVAEALKLQHYYVRIHQGAESGQQIFHLHAHIMQQS